MRYHIKLIENKPVFKVFPKENDKRLLEISLNKIVEDIQRNINFHQAPNRKLNKLIEKYKEFANSDNIYLNKLDELLSQLDDGEFSPN